MSTLSPGLPGTPLLHTFARYWWLFLLRGIVAILFGVLSFMWPGITLVTLVLFWGAFALVDGVLALAHAIMGGGVGSRWWLALVGIAGIAAGLVTFLMPGLTALVLLFTLPGPGLIGFVWVIAAYAIVFGVLLIGFAFRLKKHQHG